MNEEEVFLSVLEIDDPDDRHARVRQICGEDEALLRQVESLLAAHSRDGDFLDVPAMEQIGADTKALDAEVSPEDPIEESVLDLLQPSTRDGALGRIGHYDVLEVIGQGGFGTVVRAFDEKLHRVVAIKIMSPHLAATSPARKRFIREGRSSAGIRHENVVCIYAIEEQPIPFLVMEYVAGDTLQQRLKRTGPVGVLEVLRIGLQIANGLAAAHAQGKVHRDIKPANILLEAGADHVKITDFGLARAADDASISQSGIIAGTPMYMAPEQAQGVAIDHRADLFSFGSVLYTMCSGRPPFRASTMLAVLKRVADDTPRPIREILPEVPEWLCDIIAKLQAKRPEDRYQSAKEVADVLANCLAEYQLHGKVTVRPADKGSPVAAPSRRRRRQLAGMAAAVLLLMLLGVGLTEAVGVTAFSGSVIRLFSPEGTLVVEIDDPEVSVAIDGEAVVIKGAGLNELRVKPGQYKVLASKDGKVIQQKLVSVTKNGREVVRVLREPPPVPQTVVAAPPNLDIDRKAAEWAIATGGYFRMTVFADGKEIEVQPNDELPKTPFELRVLNVNRNPKVSEDSLQVLKGLRHLNELQISNSKATNAVLAYLKGCNKLRTLQLHGTSVTDAGLAKIPETFPELRLITVWQTAVSEAAIRKLAAAMPNCRIEWSGEAIGPPRP